MKKNFKEEIEKLNEYKENHHFSYSNIAGMIGTTTRSLRRWIKNEYVPLPIYKKAIIKLIDSKKDKRQ